VTDLVDLDAVQQPSRETTKEAIADLMFELSDLFRKYDEHELTRWSEVKTKDGRPYLPLRALAPAREAFRRLVEGVPGFPLLTPEPGSAAAALDRIDEQAS